MDQRKRRAVSVVLALSMLLALLAGCGNKDKNNAQQLSATVYVPQYVDLGVDLDDVNGTCIAGDTLYLVGETEERTEHRIPGVDGGEDEVYYDFDYSYDIYRVPLTGGTAERLPNYTGPAVPEGYEGRAYIESIVAGEDDTLWVTESTYIWGLESDSDKYYDYGGDEDFLIAAAAGEIAVAEPEPAETEDNFDVPVDDYEYFEPQDTTLLRHISSDGTELASIDLSGLPEKLGVDWLNSYSFGPEGNVYITTDEQMYILDQDLNTQFTLDLPQDYWGSVTPLSSGQACIRSWFYDEATEVYGYKITMIDLENQDWGTEYLLPSSAYSIFPGGGDYLFYYQVNDAIFGWKKDAPANAEAGERLFSWIEADVNSDNIQNFYFLPDGRVAAITREWKRNGQESHLEIGAILMTATPRDQLPEKTTLTYATLYLSYEDRGRIIDFNKTSDLYRIEVKDYSEYNTASDSSAGLQKLNTEVIAGVVPDILCTDSIPLKQYAARGYLEDLWAFIDNDPDLGRDALMTKPLEADSMNGKLYEVFSTFSIQTVVGPRNIVGDSMSWTLADLQAALERMPEGCAIFGEDDTKSGMLSSILYMNMEDFVDWDSGKCYFDSDNFKSLLAFCNSFVDEFDYENYDWSEWEDSDTRILTGKQMLSKAYLSSFDWSIQRYTALFPEGLTYVGYPMEDGSVGSCFSLSTGYAISSTCKEKDAAWSYLRQILLPESEGEEKYYYSGFPINKADFDKAMEDAMTPDYMTDENGEIMLDENGEPMTWELGSLWLNDGTEIPYHLPTQEEVDQLMSLYNAVTTVYRYDSSISEIVNDVAGSYFAGDKSLDETASLIQNRVNLYVNESK